MLKLRDVRAVMTVASSGSVSRAAAQLNLSQPAVTHAVKRVEDEIGFKLFDRSHSGMIPTAIGEVVVRRATSAFRHLVFDHDEMEWAAAVKRLKPAALATFGKTVSGSQLQTLVELAECRDAERAARRMEVTTTLIYRRLRELEAILGGAIFFKRGDTLTNTPLGDVLVRRANLVLSEMRVLQEEVRQFLGRTEGRVVVGTLPSAQTILVPRAIAELSRTHPDVRITLVDKPQDDLIAGLSSGTIDVVVGSIRPQPPGTNIRGHALFQNGLAVLARAGHRILERKTISVADLWACKWVMPGAGAPSREYFERMFERHGLESPRDIVETDSLVAMRSLLTEDDRLTMTSPHRASLEIELGVLRVVPFNLEGFSSPFGYLIRSQPITPPCLTAFLQTLQRLSRGEIRKRAIITAV